MHMSVWLGYDLQDFMFDGFTVSTVLAFVFTNILLFVLSVFFEAFKVVLAHSKKTATKAHLVLNKRNEQRRLIKHAADTNAEPGPSRRSVPLAPKPTVGRRVSVQTVLTLLHMLHNMLGFFLMLAVMLYNAYLIVSVILGLMVGYFLFGPKLIQHQMQCVRPNPVCTRECDANAEGTSATLLDDADTSSRTQLYSCETASCSGYSTPPVACRFGAHRCPAKVARLSPERRAADGSAVCCQERVTVQVEVTKENVSPVDAAPACCQSKASNESDKEVLIEKSDKGENGSCCKSKANALEEAKGKLLNLNINIVKGADAGSETEVLIENEAKNSRACCEGESNVLVKSDAIENEGNVVSADTPGCCSKKNKDYEKAEREAETGEGQR